MLQSDAIFEENYEKKVILGEVDTKFVVKGFKLNSHKTKKKCMIKFVFSFLFISVKCCLRFWTAAIQVESRWYKSQLGSLSFKIMYKITLKIRALRWRKTSWENQKYLSVKQFNFMNCWPRPLTMRGGLVLSCGI